jgi:hypothetical protein
MYAELSIYLNSAGVLIWCLRALVLGGRDAGGEPASKQLAAATTQQCCQDAGPHPLHHATKR